MARTGLKLVQVLLLLFALAIVAALALPFWYGYRIQASYEAGMAEAAGNPVSVETVRYDKGWFKSHVESLVTIADQPVKLKLDHEIVHGPFYLGQLSRGESPLVMGVVDSSVSLGEPSPGVSGPLVRFHTVISPDGGVVSELSFPEEILPTSGAPVWGRIEYVPQDESLSLQFHLPEIDIAQPMMSATIADFRIRADLQQGVHDLMLGEAALSLDQLSVAGAQGEMDIGNLRLRTVSKGRDDKVDSMFAFWGERFSSQIGEVGPVSFELHVNNLDAATLAQIDALEKEMRAAQAAGADATQAQMETMSKMMALLPQLVQNLEVLLPHFLVVTEEGRLGGSATVSLQPFDESAAMMPMVLLAAIDLDADLYVSDRLLRTQFEQNARKRIMQQQAMAGMEEGGTRLLQVDIDEKAAIETEKQLALFLTQGYLRLEGGMYRTQLALREGNLYMNGNPVNMMQLMQ